MDHARFAAQATAYPAYRNAAPPTCNFRWRWHIFSVVVEGRGIPHGAVRSASRISRYFQVSFTRNAIQRSEEGLKSLLLKEADRLASVLEKFDQAERRMKECKALISRQESFVDALRGRGLDVGPAKRVLHNLLELHDLFASFQRVMADAINRSEL